MYSSSSNHDGEQSCVCVLVVLICHCFYNFSIIFWNCFVGVVFKKKKYLMTRKRSWILEEINLKFFLCNFAISFL